MMMTMIGLVDAQIHHKHHQHHHYGTSYSMIKKAKLRSTHTTLHSAFSFGHVKYYFQITSVYLGLVVLGTIKNVLIVET